jgi:hypothetical protein
MLFAITKKPVLNVQSGKPSANKNSMIKINPKRIARYKDALLYLLFKKMIVALGCTQL